MNYEQKSRRAASDPSLVMLLSINTGQSIYINKKTDRVSDLVRLNSLCITNQEIGNEKQISRRSQFSF